MIQNFLTTMFSFNLTRKKKNTHKACSARSQSSIALESSGKARHTAHRLYRGKRSRALSRAGRRKAWASSCCVSCHLSATHLYPEFPCALARVIHQMEMAKCLETPSSSAARLETSTLRKFRSRESLGSPDYLALFSRSLARSLSRGMNCFGWEKESVVVAVDIR